MNDRDALTDLHGDRIATTEARLEGFDRVILGHNPPEIAYWERGEWASLAIPSRGSRRRRPSPVTGSCSSAVGAGGTSDFHRGEPTGVRAPEAARRGGEAARAA